jgi:hypothetical protein
VFISPSGRVGTPALSQRSSGAPTPARYSTGQVYWLGPGGVLIFPMLVAVCVPGAASMFMHVSRVHLRSNLIGWTQGMCEPIDLGQAVY